MHQKKKKYVNNDKQIWKYLLKQLKVSIARKIIVKYTKIIIIFPTLHSQVKMSLKMPYVGF